MFQCLELGLFITYLCDLLFIVILIFSMINCMIKRIQTHLFFCLFPWIYPITFAWRICTTLKQQMFDLWVLLSICLIFYQYQPGAAYKSVAYKKACTCEVFTKILSKKYWNEGVLALEMRNNIPKQTFVFLYPWW